MNCIYCNRECKNKNSLVQHQIRCKNNPNRIKGGNPDNFKNYLNKLKNKEVSVWNKGKSKETNDSIRKGSETLQKTIQRKRENGEVISTGLASTKETEQIRRMKISNTMKNNPKAGGLRYNSGRGKKGWYKGFYLRSTYELVYIIYNLDHNIKIKPCKKSYLYEYDGKQHRYYPDFELEDGTIIEIKGYMNEQTKAKIKSVTDKPIKVLFEKDLQYAFDYVKENYTYNKLEDLYEYGRGI